MPNNTALMNLGMERHKRQFPHSHVPGRESYSNAATLSLACPTPGGKVRIFDTLLFRIAFSVSFVLQYSVTATRWTLCFLPSRPDFYCFSHCFATGFA
jgi:hypothetical protein